MLKIKFKKNNHNPYIGMYNTLKMYTNKNKVYTPKEIRKVLKEGNTPEKFKLVICVLISVGDITSRQHNIFGEKKIDNGGFANKESFINILNVLKKDKPDIYWKLVENSIISEYVSYDVLLASRIKTKKNSKEIEKVIDQLGSHSDIKRLAKYLSKVITSDDLFAKTMIAKYLTRPRLSKRKNNRTLQPKTLKTMTKRATLIREISNIVDWEIVKHKNFTEYKGFYEWKKLYNADFESVMFSSGKIKTLSKEEFQSWLNTLPTRARCRVYKRLINKKEEYKNLFEWYNEWEKLKQNNKPFKTNNLQNSKDLDTPDIYKPLLLLSKSNRYKNVTEIL